MQLDKTKGYIFRIKDVEQAKAVVAVLVNQDYDDAWNENTYDSAVLYDIVVNRGSTLVMNNPRTSSRKSYTWVDTEMFLKYNPLPEVKETIQVGDTIFDKEEFEIAVSKLKGVKA